MKAKVRHAGAKVVTPEELWQESGLSREEWNRQLAEKIAELREQGKEDESFGLFLMMIDADGKSVATKLAELALAEAIAEARSNQAGSNQGSNQPNSNQPSNKGAGGGAT